MRSNISQLTRLSNAKTGGLQQDFKLTSDQYSIILLVFFCSYLIFEIPSNMVLTRVRPHIYLPGLGILWGIVAACMGATQNWSQVAGLRFVLGMVEAGFAPGCAFYLSSWYRKYELTTRYAIIYTSVPLAGALSGLLAGLITQYMEGTGGIAGWRWLFVSDPHYIFQNTSLTVADPRRPRLYHCCCHHLLPHARLPIHQ